MISINVGKAYSKYNELKRPERSVIFETRIFYGGNYKNLKKASVLINRK